MDIRLGVKNAIKQTHQIITLKKSGYLNLKLKIIEYTVETAIDIYQRICFIL